MRSKLFYVSKLPKYPLRGSLGSSWHWRWSLIYVHKLSERAPFLPVLQPLSMGLCGSRDYLWKAHRTRWWGGSTTVCQKRAERHQIQHNCRNTKTPRRIHWSLSVWRSILNLFYVHPRFLLPLAAILLFMLAVPPTHITLIPILLQLLPPPLWRVIFPASASTSL